jgi:CBS domain-containing protein
MKLEELHGKAPVTVSPAATIVEAAELMNRRGTGSVLVVDGGHLVGIVTDRDIVVRGVARRAPADARIDSVMSTDVVTIDGSLDLRDACRVFATHPLRRLPIMSDGKVLGVISVDDLYFTLVNDLADITRPVTAEALFGHAEAGLPVKA